MSDVLEDETLDLKQHTALPTPSSWGCTSSPKASWGTYNTASPKAVPVLLSWEQPHPAQNLAGGWASTWLQQGLHSSCGDSKASRILLPLGYYAKSPNQAALGSDPTSHIFSWGGRNTTGSLTCGVGSSATVDGVLCSCGRQKSQIMYMKGLLKWSSCLRRFWWRNSKKKCLWCRVKGRRVAAE